MKGEQELQSKNRDSNKAIGWHTGVSMRKIVYGLITVVAVIIEKARERISKMINHKDDAQQVQNGGMNFQTRYQAESQYLLAGSSA